MNCKYCKDTGKITLLNTIVLCTDCPTIEKEKDEKCFNNIPNKIPDDRDEHIGSLKLAPIYGKHIFNNLNEDVGSMKQFRTHGGEFLL